MYETLCPDRAKLTELLALTESLEREEGRIHMHPLPPQARGFGRN
ncbi:MAG: hypothetical protein Fur0044_37390 [Anaerolineae bacterium]